MVVTEARVVVSSCEETIITGRCYTLSMNAIFLQNMVVMVGATSVMVPMVRMCILMCLVVL